MIDKQELDRQAAIRIRKQTTELILSTAPFNGRGLSHRTVKALVDCSIDAPERLLFMTEDQIRAIPGAGKASIAEIRAYRAKFVR
jgi:DNA-directed RNA polymerase alpha subunit